MATGLWLASAPEPLIDDDNSSLRRIFRIAGALTVPAFGLLAFSHRAVAGSPLLVGATQFLIHIVFIDFIGMSRLANNFEARCQKLPRRRPGGVPGVALITGVMWLLFWIGPIRWSRTGTWTWPDADSTSAMFTMLGLGWFVVASRFHLTLRAIREELATADQASVSGAPSYPTTSN
jgi:hypothetical protein